MWQGSATELIAELGLDLKPNALAMRINVRAAKLKNDYGIHYKNTRTHAGRIILLTKISPGGVTTVTAVTAKLKV